MKERTNSGLIIGSFFKRRKIVSRLDSGRKPFREVYLCSFENRCEQILILYRNNTVPQCMIESESGCPLEYYQRTHFQGNQSQGLPSLYDYGRDCDYTWMFEEYLTETLSMKCLLNHLNIQSYVGNNMFDCLLGAINRAHTQNHILRDPETQIMVAPDNIHVRLDGNRFVLSFTGYDEMLAPMYHDMKAICDYYDLRYIAPEVLKGIHGTQSTSYCLSLALLSALIDDFPFSIKRMDSNVDENAFLVQMNQMRRVPSTIRLPKGYRDVLTRCIEKDHKTRLSIGDAIIELYREGFCSKPSFKHRKEASYYQSSICTEELIIKHSSPDMFVLHFPSQRILVPVRIGSDIMS